MTAKPAGPRVYLRPKNGKAATSGPLQAVIVFPDGRKERRGTGYSVGQEAEAEAFRSALERELGGGPPASGDGLTVREWGERWTAERIARGVVSADTERAMLRYHLFPQLGDVALPALTKAGMLDWVRALPSRPRTDSTEPLAPRTVHHIAGTVKRLLSEAVDRELLAVNPCAWRPKRDLPAKRDKVAGKRNHSGFAGWEVHALITDERVPQDRRVMYALDFLTGMRPGEVAARRWRDLDTTTAPLMRIDVASAFNSRHYLEKATKTNVEKIIPVHPLLAEQLKAWFQGGWAAFMGRPPTPDDLIVPREQGGQRTNTHSNKRFQSDLERLGLRGGRTHYETRATFRSLAIAGGAPRGELDLITHPSPREASDLYTRLEVVWPAMCRAVLAVKVEPRPEGEATLDGEVTSQVTPRDPEKEKARRLAGFGPSLSVGAAGFEPATPAV